MISLFDGYWYEQTLRWLAYLKALQLAQEGSCQGAYNGGLLAGHK